MRKSKDKARRFSNWLFHEFGVQRIPVHVHWHHPSIVTESGSCGFGVFVRGGSNPVEIHVAGKVIGTTGVLFTIAHEFAHYLQFLNGLDMTDPHIEEDAHAVEVVLYGAWLMHKNGEYCGHVLQCVLDFLKTKGMKEQLIAQYGEYITVT